MALLFANSAGICYCDHRQQSGLRALGCVTTAQHKP